MPYSESIGFIADTSDPEKIDFTTYVIAHEMAHQYWAHQVIGADMQGGTLTSETLAQYSALMVMKKLYGPDKIRRFLKYELDSYLSNRKGEVVEELPLERVENQDYIHYRKGSLAMYLLQERLGEDAVNRALARFVAKYPLQGRALSALGRPDRRVPQGSEDARAAAADHRPVRADHALRPQGDRRVDAQGRRRLDDDADRRRRQILRQRQGRGDQGQARRADRGRPVHGPARARRLLGQGRDRDGPPAAPQTGRSGSRCTARTSRPSPGSIPIISTSTATATTMCGRSTRARVG